MTSPAGRGGANLPDHGPTEVVVACYLAATVALQVIFHANQRDWQAQAAAHLAVLGAVTMLFAPAWRGAPIPVRRALKVLRVWYPLPMFAFLYAHVGEIVHIVNPGYIDGQLILADQALFHGQPSVALAEHSPAWLGQVMAFAYASYWWYGPLVSFVIYRAAGVLAARRFVFQVTLTMLTCYFIFQLLPAMGPRFALSQAGGTLLEGGGMIALVNHVVSTNGLRGAAFPSSHVAVMLAVVWGAWRYAPRPVALVGVVLCALLSVAVVYGRFHYAVDAMAGVAAGVALGVIAEAWMTRTSLHAPGLHRALRG